MIQIAKQPFGRTGHMSTKAIFGSVCLKNAGEKEAEAMLDLITEYGVNHIDTAPRYGDAELRIGRWMKRHRENFFLATKTDKLSYHDAREQFYRSLDRLQVDHVDLLQLHNMTDIMHRENIMGPGGALEFLIEARQKGLTRFLGITGHGVLAPKMHIETLDRFDFDTVLVPCNYTLLQNPSYAESFNRLVSMCSQRNIPVQTIKSIAWGIWKENPRTHITVYRPLADDDAIKKSVHWVMGKNGLFINTVGDMQLLPKVLEAVAGFRSAPSDEEMQKLTAEFGIEPLFN